MPRGVKKTCIPGLFCIENMTVFLLFVLLITVVYMYYTHLIKPSLEKTSTTSFSQPIIIAPPINTEVATTHLIPIPTRTVDPLTDINAPPLKNEGFVLPINISTQGPELNYNQMGILTREQGKDDMILPLMGRRHMAGRDKWQYYTISNTGMVNTKLPVSVKGKSCTSEYGCDSIMNGDQIYVEGYNSTFNVTIYDNGTFSYIPQL